MSNFGEYVLALLYSDFADIEKTPKDTNVEPNSSSVFVVWPKLGFENQPLCDTSLVTPISWLIATGKPSP